MDADNSLDIAETIRQLLHGPQFPGKEFVCGGATFGEVYAMAAHLQTSLAGSEHQGKMVCLAAENKAVIAAALLSSLAGGPPLLLPYAFSSTALLSAWRATGFTTAITDTTRDFPPGVHVLCPQPTGGGQLQSGSEAAPRATLLKLFTGGSTGTPQDWSKTGENIIGEGAFQARSHAVTERDCILATIPPYHIYGLLFSVALPLVSSASVIDETPVYPGDILQAAEDHDASILISVPAHYRVLQDRKLPVRLAFSSAGMLDTTTNDNFSSRNAGIVEVYGSTETGGIAYRNRSLGEEFFTPFSIIRWKIKEELLAVRSPFLSPELPVASDGFFTASDRVQAQGDRSFSMKGRADNVTKVGGKRVDLEEIKLLIQKEPEVSDCVVTALSDPGGREHRIGALIQGDNCNLANIRKTLAKTLEPYAQPRHLKAVERIPVKENGKYDWLAIKEVFEK